MSDSFDFEKLKNWESPEETGYPGPIARLPIPDSFNTETLSLDKIITEVKNRKLEKIVITYPTSLHHLLPLKEYNDASKIHKAELERLGMLDNAERVEADAERAGIAVEFLPMIKMSDMHSVRGGQVLHQESGTFKIVKPVRFWTATKPPTGAAYVFFDDFAPTGATIAGMLSHLTAHGVPVDNLLGLVNRSANHHKLGKTQKMRIECLRTEHPIVAENADWLLKLAGIDGMDALTLMEAYNIGIPDLGQFEIERFKARMEELNKGIKYYNIVPEPDNFIQKVKEIGLMPTGQSRQ